MPFRIIEQDITKVKVDAIVNAANEQLMQGGGVCGAIFRAAGAGELAKACRGIGYCATGDAVITPGFSLPARYVIHTVGPVWHGGNHGEEELLYSCYQNSLMLATANELQSIAFPLISSGIFGYPKDQALAVALQAIHDFLETHDMVVYLVVVDPSTIQIDKDVVQDISDYIVENADDLEDIMIERLKKVAPFFRKKPSARYSARYSLIKKIEDEELQSQPIETCGEQLGIDIKDISVKPKETFSSMLMRLISESGKSDPEIYKAANIDRKLFSKLRKPDYVPGKKTVLQLALALELNLDRTKDLLAKAGFGFSDARMEDLIIMYFIEHECYDTLKLEAAIYFFCGHYWNI